MPTPEQAPAWQPTTALDRVARWLGRGAVAYRLPLLHLILAGLTVGWLLPHAEIFATRAGLLVAAAAVLPVALAMLALRYTDRTSIEPMGLLLWTFLAGASVAVLAAIVNTLFAWLPTAALYLLVVGPVEEVAKLLAVYAVAYHSRHFDHAIDGVYYGVAAAAGFAAIENVAYALGSDAPWALLAARTALSTPHHLLWGAIAGYYLGVAKFIPEHRETLVTKGLLMAALGHGAYDLLVRGPDPWGFLAAAALGVFLAMLLLAKMRRFYTILGPRLLGS